MRRFGFDARTRRVIGSLRSVIAASASLRIVITSSSVRDTSVGCSTTSKCGSRISRAIRGYSAVRTTTGLGGIGLPRHQPSDHKKGASDEEQPHFESDVVAKETDEQTDR